MTVKGPHLKDIRAMHEQLAEETLRTPVLRCAAIEAQLGGETRVHAKLEFLQNTGTFKARGALATLHSLSAEQMKSGVTAVSAGNHAIATAYAAKTLGTTAKVVMIGSANPRRVASCREFGAELVIVDDVHEAFDVARRIEKEEGRFFVHPFEGESVALGAGTLGVELCEQITDFDALLVPIGGGGLIAGVSNAVKQLRPDCEIYGIEPVGADSMHRSRAAGEAKSVEKVTTIADSLGAPYALPYSFALTEENVDHLALVDDEQIGRSMGFLFREMKLAVEPACAATTAALLGPLRDALSGKRVALVMCGSNIDWDTFERQAIFDDDLA